jgi:malate dehydrogenase (oxaloacetate-decarboxylating)
VEYNGRRIPIAQCNNIYIFPAIGLGVVASGALRITEQMMLTAARTLAAHSPALVDPDASLLPPLTELRSVAAEIAVSVGLEAQMAGLAPYMSAKQLRNRVLKSQWAPAYRNFSGETEDLDEPA